MPISLRCPTCSAPLDLPAAHASTLRCPYCGAGVLLSERAGHVEAAASQERHTDAIAQVLRQLRAGSKIGAVKVYRDRFGVGLKEAVEAVERIAAGQPAGSLPAASAGNRRAALGCALMVVLIAVMGVLFFNRPGDPSAAATPPAQGVATPPPAPAATTPPGRTEEAGFAREVLRFGSEGTGAGRFEDARSVAVDGTGRIYVAEYSGGRVQVFDSAGTFMTQWMADARMPLVSMAANRDGTVYIVQSGRIRRFEGATGRALGELPRSGSSSYDDVTVALDGSLWAVADRDVVHLSREGRVLATIDLKQAVDEDAAPEAVAVAGTGDVYVLDKWKATIYHLSPAGRFVDRFGSGAFPPADDVAVDGRGRVYVSDFGGENVISVFSAAGQPVAGFGGRGVVFGLFINDRDELFAAFRNDHQVRKFQIPQAER